MAIIKFCVVKYELRCAFWGEKKKKTVPILMQGPQVSILMQGPQVSHAL